MRQGDGRERVNRRRRRDTQGKTREWREAEIREAEREELETVRRNKRGDREMERESHSEGETIHFISSLCSG